MADYNYRNFNPKAEDTRYKVNNNIIRMMNANPSLGIGYLIGNAIGENYFGKKRANTAQDAHNQEMAKYGIGADEKNGVTGVPSSAGNRGNDYYKSMNEAFNEYRNGSNGKVLYEGRSNPNAGVVVDTARGIYPRTPQQNNTSGVTVGNVDNGGGVSSVADGWNRMANGSGYNPGNTTMFTNGTRDLGNVIGADANGEFGRMAGLHPGVIIDTARGIYPAARPGTYIDTSRGIYMDSSQNTPSAAPQATTPAGPGYGDVLGLKKDGVYFPMNRPNPAPIPYTPEQLAQIQAQGYSPEELQRMGAAELIAPVTQAVAPAQASAPAQGSSGLLSAVADNAQAYAPSPISETDDHAPYYANPLSESDDHEPVVTNTRVQSKLPGYKSAIDWSEVRAEQPTFGVNVPKIFNYVVDPNNPSWLDKYLG